MFRSGLLFSCSLLAQSAWADADLAKRKLCMGCHTVDKRVVGPSYREIAARYAGQEGATALLAEKIRQGGKGVWGPLVMPPNPRLSEEDARKLAEWIESLQ